MSDIDRDGDYLVRVRAQVMTRDDSSGGWVPHSGGGLSHVCLKRILISHNGGSELERHKDYIIYGERITDQYVVLSCVIKKDIQYTVVNPKFHHWRTDDKRFGLTFERADDARAFDQGIKHVLADLTEGSQSLKRITYCQIHLDAHEMKNKALLYRNYNQGSVGPSNLTLEEDDEVFEPIDLPLERKHSSSQSASTTSTTTSSPALCSSPVSSTSPTQEHFISSNSRNHLHRIYIQNTCTKPTSSSSPNEEKSLSKSDSLETSSMGKDDCIKDEPISISGKSEIGLLESDVGMSEKYSYVWFSKPKNHDYHYPNLDSINKPSDLKRTVIRNYGPPLPEKSKKKKDRQKGSHQSNRLLNRTSRCKYCQNTFSLDNNSRGSCEYAPDSVKSCIEHVSCVTCANGVIYHCMSNAEGEFTHTCICDFQDDNNCKKWTMLTVLSFLLPCIWCYWPLFSCHMCGKKSGCCGGRHLAG